MTAPVPAPGSRVLVRDAEWVVRRVDKASHGGYQVVCDGVSELVREQEAVFLSSLEEIEFLDPAETRLTPDLSPSFMDSRLYMESQLRATVPNDDRIHVGHQAAMDLVQYQLDPARQALARPRQRILIADAVGLGKTLEAGILVSELIARGRGRRILVLVLKSMLTQFQKEFWNRFTIPLTRLDSIGIQRVRRRIPTNHNPFYYYDKTIISIDTLKQASEYRTYLEQAWWDVVVIDEAHNVADRGTASLRSHLARLLARRSDTLIMLSATPHDGKARSFASLMNMLDPTAIADPDDYAAEDFLGKGLVVRRFKKDIQHEVREAFRDRATSRRAFDASAAEEAAYDALLAVRVASRAGSTGRDLFVVTLEKALFSSPAACIRTVDKRIARRRRELEREPDEGIAAEVASLQALRSALTRIGPDDYAKYRALLAAIQGGAPFMPWSLMVFQQRNGRIDRYGQEREPRIVYLVTRSANETIRGDMRILEVLQQKDEQAYKNVGDPSALMKVHDIEEEEKITTKAIASGEEATRFDERLQPGSNEGDDLLKLFLGTGGDSAAAPRTAETPPPPRSVFDSDLAYCEAALHRLRRQAGGGNDLRFEVNRDSMTMTFDAPDDLRHRFGYLSREIVPESWRFELTADGERMNEAIAESRRNEEAWPRQHYLWRLNPVVGWLNDRMLALFGRHEAPVVASGSRTTSTSSWRRSIGISNG